MVRAVVKGLGLALQIVGTLIAAIALGLEFRAGPGLQPLRMTEPRRDRRNPWRQDLNLKNPRRVTKTDRQEWASGSMFHGAFAGSDPDLLEFVEFVGSWLKKREGLLGQDWETNAARDAETRSAIVSLFHEQSRLLVDQHNRTRKRVLWEMVGLALVLLGTTLSGL